MMGRSLYYNFFITITPTGFQVLRQAVELLSLNTGLRFKGELMTKKKIHKKGFLKVLERLHFIFWVVMKVL